MAIDKKLIDQLLTEISDFTQNPRLRVNEGNRDLRPAHRRLTASVGEIFLVKPPHGNAP